MNNFDKISKTIEKEHIVPTPKIYFQIKKVIFWLLFLISILIGSIAFSIILFSVQEADFVLIRHLNHSYLETILTLLPFFWLLMIFIFTLLGFFSFKNFKKAYKYPWYSIMGLNVFLSIIFGTVLFLNGYGKFLENTFANQVEIYRSVEKQKLKHWMNPEAGLLAGEIIQAKQDTLLLNDFNNQQWKIYYHNVFIPPILELEIGEQIKIMGNKQSENSFKANDIRPWKAHRKYLKGKKRKQ